MNRDRLYGVPSAEYMSFDLESAYESADYWTDVPGARPDRVVIEEWTVTEPIAMLPAPADALETLIERYLASKLVECVWEDWEGAARNPHVIDAMRSALELLASKVSTRMADKHAATHVVTFDDDGEPILNGERLYRPVTA